MKKKTGKTSGNSRRENARSNQIPAHFFMLFTY